MKTLADGLNSRVQQPHQKQRCSVQRIMHELIPDHTFFESEIQIVNKTTAIIDALYEAGLNLAEFFKVLWENGYNIPAEWPIKKNGEPLSCTSKKTREALPAINRLVSAWDMRNKRAHDHHAAVVDTRISDNDYQALDNYSQETVVPSPHYLMESQTEVETFYSYLLRCVPTDIYVKAQQLAEKRSMSLRTMIISLLEQAVEKDAVRW